MVIRIDTDIRVVTRIDNGETFIQLAGREQISLDGRDGAADQDARAQPFINVGELSTKFAEARVELEATVEAVELAGRGRCPIAPAFAEWGIFLKSRSGAEAGAVVPQAGTEIRSSAERHRGEHIDGSSEEHTSELQSLMRISSAVFCMQKKKKN